MGADLVLGNKDAKPVKRLTVITSTNLDDTYKGYLDFNEFCSVMRFSPSMNFLGDLTKELILDTALRTDSFYGSLAYKWMITLNVTKRNGIEEYHVKSFGSLLACFIPTKEEKQKFQDECLDGHKKVARKIEDFYLKYSKVTDTVDFFAGL